MCALDLDAPVLIVGSASTGNTLLGVMLDRHSHFACGPELYAFDKKQIYGSFARVKRKFPEWLRSGLLSDGQIDTPDFFHAHDAYFCDREWLSALAEQSVSLRDLFDRFFRHYLDRRSKFRWVEKTGSNVYCLDKILELYPSARVIHTVRDGRDVMCSLAKRNATPYHAASHWLYHTSAALAWRGVAFLDRHSHFACGPELYAFDKKQIYGSFARVKRKFPEWLRSGLLSDGQIDTPDFFHAHDAYFCDREWLSALAEQSVSLRDLFDRFFRHYLDRRSKFRWVEKTGSNVYCLDKILELYPSARVIHN